MTKAERDELKRGIEAGQTRALGSDIVLELLAALDEAEADRQRDTTEYLDKICLLEDKLATAEKVKYALEQVWESACREAVQQRNEAVQQRNEAEADRRELGQDYARDTEGYLDKIAKLEAKLAREQERANRAEAKLAAADRKWADTVNLLGPRS